MNSTLTYIDGFGARLVGLPEVEFKTLPDGCELRPIRGDGASLAVLTTDGAALGWILAERLGFPTARAWMIGTGYKVKDPRVI